MNPTHDLERRIADHYQDEAPPRAPDWLLGRALETISTTQQRRAVLGRPWRIPRGPSVARLALAPLAIAGVIGLALLQGPAIGPMAPTSPEPSAVPAPLTQRFTSTLNGISMDYPVGWQTRPATEPWTDGVLGFDAPGVDIIFDPTSGENLYFALASEPLRGRPDDIWRKSLTLPPCPGGHGGGVVTVDGATGWVVACGGASAGSRVDSALLVTDTRAYAIVLYAGSERLAETYSSDWFWSVVQTMELE